MHGRLIKQSKHKPAHTNTNRALTGVEDGESVGLPGHALAGVHVDARDVHLLSRPGHVDQVPQQNHLEEWVSEMIEWR